MSDVTGFVTGLANSLNQYLGTQYKAQTEAALNKNKIDLETQSKMTEETNKQNLEMQRQQNNKKFEQSLEGQVDPTTANSVVPGSGHMVDGFKAMNGRYPTVSEAHQLFQSSPKAQGLHETDPQDLYQMAQVMDVPQDKLGYIKSLKSPIATGLAEKLLGVGEKGINETSLYKSFQESTQFDTKSTPQQKEASWTQFRASMLEPGKETITDEETMNKAVQGLDSVAQKAMANGQSLSQAMATAAMVIKKYDKRTKAKLLIRSQMDMQKAVRAQQNQGQTQGQ